MSDALLVCSGNTFTSLIELIASEPLDAPTTRRSSVTLLDCASDFFSLVTSTEQLRFVQLKLLCLSFLVRGHLIAAFVEAPLVIWRCFVLFVSSFGPFNIDFTSGNQHTQLASNSAQSSSHSFTLRLSRLCVSIFVRSNMRSTLCNNACLFSRYSNTRSFNFPLQRIAFYSSSLSSMSLTRVRSLPT